MSENSQENIGENFNSQITEPMNVLDQKNITAVNSTAPEIGNYMEMMQNMMQVYMSNPEMQKIMNS